MSDDQLSFTQAYEQDSMTWCIARSKLLSKRANYTFLIRNTSLFYYTLLALGLVTILSYMQGYFEAWRYDCWTMMGKIVQVAIGSTIKLNVRKFGTKLILLFEYWASLWFCITFMAFYTTVIQQTFHKYQIHTIQELIDERFELAGDAHALNYLRMQTKVEMGHSEKLKLRKTHE